MKKILGSLVIALFAAAMSTHALADGPHGYRPRAEHRHGHHRGGADWLGPLIVLGIAGAAISAAANQPSYTPPPQVTYVPPPPPAYTPPAPPSSASYYCGSVGQFYPYTAYCPEGWQLVSTQR